MGTLIVRKHATSFQFPSPNAYRLIIPAVCFTRFQLTLFIPIYSAVCVFRDESGLRLRQTRVPVDEVGFTVCRDTV